MRRALLVLAFTLAALAGPDVTHALPASPTPATPVSDLLPAPALLGDGWTETTRLSIPLDGTHFREGATSTLAGPAGARLTVVIVRGGGDAQVRRTWEDAVALFNGYRGEITIADGRAGELDQLPLPDGCIEARRIDGTARQLGLETGIPIGVTLCAGPDDLLVVVAASGTILGASGNAAADAVTTLLLQPVAD